MKIPGFKRLQEEDYNTDEKPFVRKLAYSLNIGIETLYQALNKRLTFKDNFQSTIQEFSVIVNSSGVPTSPVIIKLNQSGVIEGIQSIKSRNLDSPASSVPPFNINFTQISEGIRIDYITGLVAGTRYSIKIATIN